MITSTDCGARKRLDRLPCAASPAAARLGGRVRRDLALSPWGGALVWALVVAAASPALAADLNLLATSSVNAVGGTVGETSFSQESFINSLDANYNRPVTSLFSYRLRLLGSGDESRVSAGDSSLRTSSWFVQPEGDVTLSGPRYSLNLGGKYRESWFQNSLGGSRSQNEDYEFIRAFLTPELLPSLNMQLERNAQSDDLDPRSLDRERTRAVATLGYGLLGQRLLFGYTFTREAEDDEVTRLGRELLSQVGTVGFTDSYFDDRLSVNANYLVNWVETTEQFSASTVGGVTVAPVVISGAFALTETNPTVPAVSKVPPASYTTLTSAVSTTLAITAPLVVDQGGAPNLNQSIAFGLTPGTSITTIRLTVAPRSGDPRDIALQAQGVTFQAFVGTNPGVNLTAWSAVPVLSVSPPTTVNSYFEITIGATSGTFLKVHVAGDTQQPVLPPVTATAVTALSPAAAGGGSTKVRTSNLLQFVNGSLTGTPIRDLTLGANASFSFNDQDPAGRQDTSGNYSFTATGTPHRPELSGSTAVGGGSERRVWLGGQVLGTEAFARAVTQQVPPPVAIEAATESGALARLEALARRVAADAGVPVAAICGPSKQPAVVAARRRLIIEAVSVEGIRPVDVSRFLGVSRAAVTMRLHRCSRGVR